MKLYSTKLIRTNQFFFLKTPDSTCLKIYFNTQKIELNRHFDSL